MKQSFTQHHFTEQRIDPDGFGYFQAPAGGHSFGVGFSISWQNGPLRIGIPPTPQEPNGCFVETIIAAVIGRLDFYQGSKFRCASNQVALDHLHAALGALESRTKDREDRGVEGTHKQ